MTQPETNRLKVEVPDDALARYQVLNGQVVILHRFDAMPSVETISAGALSRTKSHSEHCAMVQYHDRLYTLPIGWIRVIQTQQSEAPRAAPSE